MDPFVIKMRDEDEGGENQKTYLDYEGNFEEEQLKVEQAKDVILEYLEEQNVKKTAKEIIEVLAEKRIGKSNVENAIKYMRDHKEIEFNKEGKAYWYWVPQKDCDNEDVSEQDIPSS